MLHALVARLYCGTHAGPGMWALRRAPTQIPDRRLSIGDPLEKPISLRGAFRPGADREEPPAHVYFGRPLDVDPRRRSLSTKCSFIGLGCTARGGSHASRCPKAVQANPRFSVLYALHTAALAQADRLDEARLVASSTSDGGAELPVGSLRGGFCSRFTCRFGEAYCGRAAQSRFARIVAREETPFRSTPVFLASFTSRSRARCMSLASVGKDPGQGIVSALPQQPICAANHNPSSSGDAGQDDISALCHARDVCLELGLIVDVREFRVRLVDAVEKRRPAPSPRSP